METNDLTRPFVVFAAKKVVLPAVERYLSQEASYREQEDSTWNSGYDYQKAIEQSLLNYLVENITEAVIADL